MIRKSLMLASGILIWSSPSWAQFSVQESFNATGFTFSFFSLASTESDQTELANSENGTGRISTYNYLTAGTRLNYDYKAGVRLPFIYNTAGRDRFNDGQVQDQELLLQDVILFLKDDSIALLPLDIGVYWEGRIYLPTSENSRRAGTIGSYRNHFILNKLLTRTSELEYDQKVTYVHQSRTAYLNKFENERGEPVEIPSLTKAWEVEQRFNYWYRIDAETGVGLQLTLEDKFYNSSVENSKKLDRSEPLRKGPIHTVKLGPATRFALNSKVNFILTYNDVVDTNDNRGELGQFKAENTEFALLSFVRF